jgi:PAS domain S-box-containing protein
MDVSRTIDHLVIDALSSHIAIVDQEGLIVAVNQAWQHFADVNGARRDKIGVGVNYLAVCRAAQGETALAAAAGIGNVLAGTEPTFAIEYPCHSATENRWFLMQVTPLAFVPAMAVVAHHNITERKEAENALAQERNLLRTVIDHLPDFIFAKAPDGQFMLVNQAYAQFLGVASPEAVRGKRVFDFYPNALARQYQAADRTVLETGQTVADYEVPTVNRDGTPRLHLTTKCPLFDEQGHVRGLVGIGRDITEHKQDEEEKNQLLAAIMQQRSRLRMLSGRLAESQETQRKQIARELHDQVGQNLTALGFTLKLIQSQILADLPLGEQLKLHLQDALQLVSQTTEAIRHLMTELRPPVLDDYGVVVALHWYAEQMRTRSGLQINVYGESPTPRLSEVIENALFRIVQEAINNTLKHGQATEVTIRVTSTDDRVSLVIADNGQGFDPQAANISQSGWGLLTMRERAEAVGGHCHIISQPGAGVSVIVEVPR